MKFRLLAAGMICVLLALFIALNVLPSNSFAQEKKAGDYRISGPYIYENLTIYLVHGKDTVDGKKFLTLQEALEKRAIIVYETKDVNELAIENVSPDEEVYVQSGDIVKGGQQDRVLAVDLIVPPRSGKIPIAAFCVESGRWERRGGEAAGKFESSNDRIATRDLKLAANAAKSQTEVWAKVSEAQEKLSQNVSAPVNSTASASSLQLSLENGKVKEFTDKYVQKLAGIIEGKSDVIGYAFAINGRVNSADVYASSALFRKLWPKLLKASAVEAVADLQKGQKFEAVKSAAVEEMLTEDERAKSSENEVTNRVKVVTRESDEQIVFETRDKKQPDAVLHRSYVKKQ